MTTRQKGMPSVERVVAFVLFCLSLSMLRAQYGPQIPIPSIGRHNKPTQDSKTDSNHRPAVQTEGLVQSNDGKTLVVASKDGRTFTIALTDKTSFNKNGKSIAKEAVVPGATVQVEAAPDDQDNLSAVTVNMLKDPEPQAVQSSQGPASPAQPEQADQPHVTILQSPVDAPNRPILHHGSSERRTGSNEDDTAKTSTGKTAGGSPGRAAAAAEEKDDGIIMEPDPSAAPAAPKKPPNELIARATEWVSTFAGSLPNYVCQQSTTRFQEESRQAGWQALDVVTAQVVYEDGKESYRDITVGGKKTNKSMLDLGGSTSTGEFASTLRGLFSPSSHADFKLYHTTHIGQSEAAVYDFKVDLRNSGWQIRVGGQNLRPAYSGSVWIDKNTAEVRRIEMQADSIPTDFPLDAVEWAVDYDKVMLGASSFFLPVHAENLGCQRGSTICMKNTVDFRNYHKYSGESTIKFGQ